MITVTLDTARFNARLARFVAVTTRDAEQVVFEVAAQVLGDTVAGWPVDSGASRAAWSGPRKVGPLSYQISNPFRYSTTIEYGNYPHPGEKTAPAGGVVLPGGIQIGTGIFPRQTPFAPLRRALSKSYGEMGKKIKESHQQHWGR